MGNAVTGSRPPKPLMVLVGNVAATVFVIPDVPNELQELLVGSVERRQGTVPCESLSAEGAESGHRHRGRLQRSPGWEGCRYGWAGVSGPYSMCGRTPSACCQASISSSSRP